MDKLQHQATQRKRQLLKLYYTLISYSVGKQRAMKVLCCAALKNFFKRLSPIILWMKKKKKKNTENIGNCSNHQSTAILHKTSVIQVHTHTIFLRAEN